MNDKLFNFIKYKFPNLLPVYLRPLNYDEFEDKRVVILQSGGLDSNVIASVFRYFGFEMHHIYVNYGQNSHNKELEYAKKIAEYYGGTFTEVDLTLPWLKDTTTLVDNVVEDGDVENTEMNTYETLSYVPLRNQVLVSIAGSYAEAYKIPYIACAFDGSQNKKKLPTGGTTDKHPEFVKQLEKSINEGSAMKHILKTPIKILTPVMANMKVQIIGLGIESGADMSISWSCYNNGDTPCGKCSACVTRDSAFSDFGIEDPART